MFPYDMAQSNPNKLLIENYVFNMLTVRALMEFMKSEDRKTIEKWVAKLETMNQTPEQLLYRSHYMWFLLIVLQRQKLTYPFNQRPAFGTLKPLHEVLPVEVYEDVISSATTESKATDRAIKELDGKVEEDESLKGLFPSHFFENQPMPFEGSFCYAAVFSDFSTTQGI